MATIADLTAAVAANTDAITSLVTSKSTGLSASDQAALDTAVSQIQANTATAESAVGNGSPSPTPAPVSNPPVINSTNPPAGANP